MPLPSPPLDSRTYQDLFDQAVARIPVHTPEWTNFNASDPGITIVGVFAFLTESILYRCNQIPDRNRLKFLQLLGVPLAPAVAAQGLVSFANTSGPSVVFTLDADLEVDAGAVPFRTESGLDVLPLEARVYFKQPYQPTDTSVQDYYQQLYASYVVPPANVPSPQNVTLALYQLATLGPGGASSVDLGADTVDGSIWIALLARAADASDVDGVRQRIAGRTLNLGIVPGIVDATVDLPPNPTGAADLGSILGFYMPAMDPGLPVPSYRRMDATADGDVLGEPGVVEITLPTSDQLQYWSNTDPLEAGTAQYPPTLDDTTLAARLITWIRISILSPTDVDIVWTGINAAQVTQLTHVQNEVLPDGTGAPEQTATLAHAPVIADSVSLTVTVPGSSGAAPWVSIDDLMAAGPEVPVVDPTLPPGTVAPASGPTQVFLLDPEAGKVTFGDGTHGARPPGGSKLLARYDYCVGAAGNVEVAAISAGPALPSGVTVSNPVRTWGGANAEAINDGVKQITRFLQHRDRLVTKADFEALVWRTPGVSVGRVDVLPAFDPWLAPNAPGDAPGVVTTMVLPSYDPDNPQAPVPSQSFLNAVAGWLMPRRLVTTELIVVGPTYVDVWLSVGITVVPGASAHDTTLAVKAALVQFLSPLPPPGQPALADTVSVFDAAAPTILQVEGGWPLLKPVVSLEVQAVASRVAGVLLVGGVSLGTATGDPVDQIPMTALSLPRLAGISVSTGDPLDLDALRGQQVATGSTAGGASPPNTLVVAVPVVPEGC